MPSKIIPDKDASLGKDDLAKVEQSLFADVGVGSASGQDDSIGLLPKSKRNEGSNYTEEKTVVLKINPSKIKERAKRGLFWLLLVVLVVSFFYNPFYQYFPWNQGSGLTGRVVAETEDEASEDDITLDAPDDSEIVAVETEPPAEEPLVEITEEEPDGTPAPPSNDASTLEVDSDSSSSTVLADEDNEEDPPTSPVSHTITFNLTDVEVIKTTYGWKVSNVSFTIVNNKEVFTAKVRARGYNTINRMDVRGDKFLVLGDIQEGDTYTGDITLNAQFDTPGEKLVYVELYDEGDERGAANDRRLATVEKKITLSP